ncbi:uncharacterized protein LOC118421112 [Branchiostoma floridae]|uniref:Uncharacterized protein LOC118421112 n=1 Tax=Branchiostoma floridae TaxID=7739 RepID=A0A9J7LL69_BRAFL|nr:uncharacterized protein LOC118421112 [Branchiostoma floridae]
MKAVAQRGKASGAGSGNGDYPKPLQCRNWPLSSNGNRGQGNYTRAGEGDDTADHAYSSLEVDEGEPKQPRRAGGEEAENTGRTHGTGAAVAPPPPAGPLIRKRHLKQCLIGTLVMSAVVLASVALVISLKRPGHSTVVIHVTNSSGIDDVAAHLMDDVQKTNDDVSKANEHVGTRLGLKDSTERAQKKSGLQKLTTTPGLPPQESLGPQASPADHFLTNTNISLPYPPSQPPVIVGPVGTTMGETGKPQPFTIVVNPHKSPPHIDPVPQKYTTLAPKPFEQHAPDTTPQPNANKQTPFDALICPETDTYNIKPIPPMTMPPILFPTPLPAPSDTISSTEMLNITCQDQRELWAGTGNFSSPEYPQKYPRSLCITWRITTEPGKCITITFEDFSVEGNLLCMYDKVWVITNGTKLYGPMCSTDVPERRRGREVELTFVSDDSLGKRGFLVQYSSQAWHGPGCG